MVRRQVLMLLCPSVFVGAVLGYALPASAKSLQVPAAACATVQGSGWWDAWGEKSSNPKSCPFIDRDTFSKTEVNYIYVDITLWANCNSAFAAVEYVNYAGTAGGGGVKVHSNQCGWNSLHPSTVSATGEYLWRNAHSTDYVGVDIEGDSGNFNGTLQGVFFTN